MVYYKTGIVARQILMNGILITRKELKSMRIFNINANHEKNTDGTVAAHDAEEYPAGGV